MLSVNTIVFSQLYLLILRVYRERVLCAVQIGVFRAIIASVSSSFILVISCARSLCAAVPCASDAVKSTWPDDDHRNASLTYNKTLRL